MPNRYYTRRFLNKRGHHAGAYILAFVEDTSRRKKDLAGPTSSSPWLIAAARSA
ncbi:MAG TPA: hypothetical protein VFP89_00090 [Propionibacteriaceae bacterium]|nr:hypothetical protein [Propionibacteriaceae bacterium]